MPDAGAVTLGDCHRQGRIMKCPRYGGHRLDKLIATCGPYYSLEQLAAFMSWDCAKRQAAFMSWDCAKRQAASIDDPCGARCLDRPRQ